MASGTGGVTAFLRGKGEHLVELEFRLPVTRVNETGWLDWEQPRMPVTRVNLALTGTGRDVEVVPALATETRESAGSTRASAVVRMSSHVFVRWFERGEQAVVRVPSAQETRVEAESATELQVHQGRVTGRTELTYRVTQGALAGLKMTIPTGAEVLEVSGAPVKNWRTEASTLDVGFDRYRSDSGQVKEGINPFVDLDAYRNLQRSLGERGVLPVGVRNTVQGAVVLRLEGSLYPAGGTPASITLLVYDPSVRTWFDFGLGLFAFFAGLLALEWAARGTSRVPLFLSVCLLPAIGCAIDWYLGSGSLPWIGGGFGLGLLGAVFRSVPGGRPDGALPPAASATGSPSGVHS